MENVHAGMLPKEIMPAAGDVYVSNADELIDAVNNALDLTNIIITDDIYLDETLYIDSGITLTIQSDTTPVRTIYMTGNVRHFEISNGFILRLTNIRLDKTGSGIGGGVSVIGDGENQSQLYMTEGSVIANTRAINGGAIYGNNGCNIVIDEGLIEATVAEENGGGIYIIDSTLMIALTTIQDATAGEYGGGLYSINSTVDFISSAIDSNTASSKGGGMYLESSEGIIDDAFFSGNTAITAGGAIYVTGRAQSNFININGSTFNENRVDGVNGYGGAMCVDNSVNVNLYNLVFNSNSASKGYGGAIAMNSEASLLIRSCVISNNTATSGGGIYAYNYSLFYIMGDHGIYSNGADEFGGGVCLEDYSVVYVYDDVAIKENSARYGGGVYLGYGSSFLQVEAETSITDNSATDGGGIYAYDNSWIQVSMGSFSITDNRADNFGGGVYLKSSYLTYLRDFGVSVHEINIERNSARYGGGVYLENNSVVYVALTLEEIMKIVENSAVSGGGIYAYDNSRIILYGYNEISGNIADEFGGGVFLKDNSSMENYQETVIEENSATNGGGIYACDNSQIRASENGIFSITDNIADEFGGGVYLENNSVFEVAESLAGDTAISNNSATNGGGIYACDESLIRLSSGYISITDNSADDFGGGVYLGNNSVFVVAESLAGDTAISNNSATNGGGIYADGGELSISSTIVTNNEAAGSGGGIYSTQQTKIGFRESSIKDNKAAKDGGGIYVDGGELAFLSTIVTNNETAGSGGGIYSTQQTMIIVSGLIKDNKAAKDGGGIYADGSELHLVSTTVSGNATDGSGGGIYITQQTQLNVDAASTITSNNAAKDGGGIFTMDYSYRNPANIAKYANINAHDAAFSNNTAGTLSSPPINKDAFNSRFNGNLLDNYNINYKIATVIFSVSNTVSGKYADLNSEFEYTITLSGMSEIPTYLDYRYNDGTTGTLDLTDGTAQFTLKNDQTIYFEVPALGTVQIQQNQLPGYSVSYSIDGNPEVESANLTLTLNDLPVTVDFYNRFTEVVPTGISSGLGFGLLLIISASLLIALFAASVVLFKRRRG